MKQPYQEINVCRLCAAPDLEEVWDLGEQWVVDFLEQGQEGFKAPLVVVLCRGCGLAQLKHTVDRDLMYRKYFYRSGTSETMKEALKHVAQGAIDRLGRHPKVVCDIGANDGTLLSFLPIAAVRIAFEPARNIEVANATEVIQDYFGSVAIPYWHREVELAFAVAMFYDVSDPLLFIENIRWLLRKDGIWVNQMNFVGPVMRNNAFDFLSHEHLSLWDLPTFVKAVSKAGLEVFDLEELPLNGGTYRVFVGHQGHRPVTTRVAHYLLRDAEYKSASAWRRFKQRVYANGIRLRGTLNDIKAQGKTVAVLGASTRGNSLLQAYGLDVADLAYASDRDPNKWGKRLAGTNIPIVSEEEARKRKPDYFLVLPYSYIDQIKLREKDFLGRGGRFIVPLPVTKVIP
jgi:NDP-4-keto-2,6-dideoxyhexose 3-C-methyltransferase